LSILTLHSAEIVEIKGGERIIPPSCGFYCASQASITVSVKKFNIDRYEVSNEKYHKKNIQEDESHFPVVHISYEDAQKFCEKMGGTLPTNEEWMVAASFENGEFHPYSTKVYPINNEEDINVVEERASELETEGFGIFTDLVDVEEALKGKNNIIGMLGNVWEMVLSDGKYVTLKGGSFYNAQSPALLDSRANNKVLKSTLDQYEHIGFRCVYK